MEQTQSVYSAMQSGKPLERWQKTIVGKVSVVTLNPFTEEPEGVILEGSADDSFIELWTVKAVVFFSRLNKKHIAAGRLTKIAAPPEEEVSPNILDDGEIDALLKSPFFTLKSRVEKFTEVAPLLRIINRARELEKSEKIIKYLESQMSAIELAGYE